MAGKAASEEARLRFKQSRVACSPWEEQVAVAGRNCKGQGCGGCVQRRLPAKWFMPRRKRAARPLAVSEIARRAGSCRANAQAAGNAEVVAVVRCTGSGGGQREVVS